MTIPDVSNSQENLSCRRSVSEQDDNLDIITNSPRSSKVTLNFLSHLIPKTFSGKRDECSIISYFLKSKGVGEILLT